MKKWTGTFWHNVMSLFPDLPKLHYHLGGADGLVPEMYAVSGDLILNSHFNFIFRPSGFSIHIRNQCVR